MARLSAVEDIVDLSDDELSHWRAVCVAMAGDPTYNDKSSTWLFRNVYLEHSKRIDAICLLLDTHLKVFYRQEKAMAQIVETCRELSEQIRELSREK